MPKTTATLLGLLISIALFGQGIYNLWGMTVAGGSENVGVIFKTDGQGNNFQTIYNFSLTNSGHSPYGSLAYHNGKLYGMLGYGGNYNTGALFEIDPVTGTYTEKLSLSAGINGTSGSGTLVLYNNKLYGIGAGGTSAGVIFEWDPITNVYTKKIDLTGIGGEAPGAYPGALTLLGNKFYGVTYLGGSNNEGVLFEWNPASNIYIKRLDFTGLNNPYPTAYDGTLTVNDGILYGTGLSGGDYSLGVIFHWNPADNTYTKRFDFGNPFFGASRGSSPFSGLTPINGKFYGMTMDGGLYGLGLLYEWDPVTGIQFIKHDFDGESTGKNPMSRLAFINGKFYGMTGNGGVNDKGILFEFNPATALFTKKMDFDGINAGYSASGNMVVPVPAPVAAGVPGACTQYASVLIDDRNNNDWVPLTDNDGNAIAEIKANGNNLGTVNAQIFVNGGAPREDRNKNLYLDRNLTVTPQVQPSSPVDIRIYITKAEFDALKNANNSIGQPSGITAVSDLGMFKNNDVCAGGLFAGATPVLTLAESWQNGYVLSASINSFSTFYFASNTNTALPIDFISFTGEFIQNKGLIKWTTANELNAHSFEIERSVNGTSYITIGHVAAFNSAGDHHYTFDDNNIIALNAPIIFYRLKQIDINGRYTYSKIIGLTIDRSANSILFYPNPVRDHANLNFILSRHDRLLVKIIDNTGRVISQSYYNMAVGNTNLWIDVNGIAAGYYYLDIKGAFFVKQIRFIKQ